MANETIGNPFGKPKGRIHNPETRRHMSEAQRKRHEKNRAMEAQSVEKQTNDSFIAWMLSIGAPE